MLPTESHGAKFIGRVGAELDVEVGREAAYLAALNVLAVAWQHLGSLDKVTRIVRPGVSVATAGDVRDQPKVAGSDSESLQDVFGKDKSPCRLVHGVASLPLGTPVELEVIEAAKATNANGRERHLPEDITDDRRRFILPADELSMFGQACAESSETRPADLPIIEGKARCNR